MSQASRIILVGYRGTGKSAVGRRLADLLDWSFLDADAVLEERTGRSIADLFAQEGEAGFRERESVLLAELLQLERHIIATGGGVVLSANNQQLLSQAGFVAWLTAAPELLWERVSADPDTAFRRPNLTATGGVQEIRSLLAAREPLYRAVATAEFPTANRSPEQVAGDILAAWRTSSCSR